MKKFTLFLIIFLIGSGGAFAQTGKAKKKPAVKTKAQKIAAKSAAGEREQFDPLANPNADLQKAIAKAQAENKRIILDVGGEWCGWCRKMDYYFLENKALTKLRDDNFIWIKVNFSPENENKAFLAKYPPIPAYPHLFVLETDGSFLHSQDTTPLEEQNLPVRKENPVRKVAEEKGYDLFNFVQFLKTWSIYQ